jgi:DNA-binding transcriptional ArsR family regulator
VLSEWEMEGYEPRMLEEWKGERGARKGYRTLAREIDIRLLRREMDRAGVTTLADEAESRYDRLTGDDETVARETRELLRNEGVPIDALESDFVSYATVRTHLRECLDAEYEAEPSSGRWVEESIRIAKGTAQSKVEEAVKALVNRDDLEAGGNVDVEIDVMVTCTACQSRIPIDRAIRRGAVCSCQGTESSNPRPVDE